MSRERISVQLRSPLARLPTRGTPYSAGLDLYCAEETVLPPYRSNHGLTPIRVPLHISTELPFDTYGRITGRSNTTMRGIYVLSGVLDADYRGSIDVMVTNLRAEEIVLRPGERIAQLVLERVVFADVVNSNELSPSSRGEQGFGSTGNV